MSQRGRPLNIPAAGDVPPKAVAQRLGVTEQRLAEILPALLRRGFPRPDPVTGNYCIEAVDRWRLLRHAELFPDFHHPGRLTSTAGAMDASVLHAQRRAAGG